MSSILRTKKIALVDCNSFLLLSILTLKIIPTAIQVIQAEVPPLLINGKVWPVTGKTCNATPIFINAWIIIGNPSPITNNFEKIVFALNEITVTLNIRK